MKTKIRLGAAALLLWGASTACVGAQEKTIGISIPSLGSSFWISAVYGLQSEAEAQGYRVVKLDAGSDTNTTQQIAQIQDLIQRHVAAIVIGPTNGDAVVPVVEQAINAGIPVIAVSYPPSTDRIASLISADHAAMGKLQAECLGKALNGTGQVAMISGPSGQAWADLRADAFRATVKEEFPGISIVAESRLAENRNAALTTTEDWLQRFPDLAGIYTATDDIAGGAAVAIKGAGRKGEIKVSTSNFTPAGRKMLESGDIVCTSIQQVVDQGRSAMKQAIAASTHGEVQKLVVSPALLVTPDNIASVDMSGVNAPNDYKP